MFNEKNLSIGIVGSLLAFLATVVLSTIYSVNAAESFDKALIFLAGVLLMYVASKGAQHEKYSRYLEIILIIIILYSLAISVKSLYQHVILHIPRPRSLVGNPNYAARYLELSIPIVTAMLFYRGLNTRNKILLIVVSTILFGGLLVTYTRGAWIAIAVVMILLLLINRAYKMIGYISCAGVIGIISLQLFFKSSLIVKRLNTLSDLKFRSNSERLYGWISSLDIIRDYPLTGIGFANFAAVYSKYKLPAAKMILAHAHNTFLVLATEGGILCALSFTLFCIFFAAYVIKGYKLMSSSFYRCLVAGLGLAMLALMINGFVDNAFTRAGVWGVFALEAGICLGIVKKLGYNKVVSN